MKKTILYIGNFSFPIGNAAGKRVYANGKLLRELGYEVIFIGMDKEVNRLKSLEKTKKEYDGFAYYNYPYPNRQFDWMNYRKVFNELTRFIKNENLIDDLALVIYYGSPRLSLFNSKLISFLKKRKINTVADCVDWLTTKTNNPLFDIIKWGDNTYQKAYANKKADGVIAISSYLSNYYKKYGCKTVIIPPLSPIEYGISETRLIGNDNKIITYAGLPFRIGQPVADCNKLKDRIDKTIILLHEAKRNGCKFIFNIYGFTERDYIQAIPNQKKYIDELGNSIVFHGHKPNEEVTESIINSDFTILFRDINRDTTSGFPTKVSESISCGTPVITTKTSDLENYIVEGELGFFIDVKDNQSALSVLQKALEMNNKEIKIMKKKCINSKVFHYKNYYQQMRYFLEDLES